MAKPPAAMPLYIQDFLQGTDAFTNEEVGAYVRAIVHQWEYGAVPADDPPALAALLHVSRRRALRLWSRIGPKFYRGADAQWRNLRCQAVRDRAVDYSKRQAGPRPTELERRKASKFDAS